MTYTEDELRDIWIKAANADHDKKWFIWFLWDIIELGPESCAAVGTATWDELLDLNNNPSLLTIEPAIIVVNNSTS